MTPFSWGARRGVVAERTEPTLKNQGWGTRKTVSVERAEGRMEALRGSGQGGATKEAKHPVRS